MVKTEGDYITPASYIMDTLLLGHECVALQQRLAHSLDLPLPETGRCNIHCGILVRDGNVIYQITECISPAQRMAQQRQSLPPDKTSYYYDKLSRLHINRTSPVIFPFIIFRMMPGLWSKKHVWNSLLVPFSLLRQGCQIRFPHRFSAFCGCPVSVTTVSALCLRQRQAVIAE